MVVYGEGVGVAEDAASVGIVCGNALPLNRTRTPQCSLVYCIAVLPIAVLPCDVVLLYCLLCLLFVLGHIAIVFAIVSLAS